MRAFLTKLTRAVVDWFSAPAMDIESPCARCIAAACNSGAVIAPAGSTVVLRCPVRLSIPQRERLVESFEREFEALGVRFVLLDGDWEALVVVEGSAGQVNAKGPCGQKARDLAEEAITPYLHPLRAAVRKGSRGPESSDRSPPASAGGTAL